MPFEVRNEAESVEILLYDYIDSSEYWGVTAKQIKQAFDDADGKPVDLHIDSGGGDVFEAFAMCSIVQRYEGKTTAYIDGLAASAASYLAVVCDEVIMRDYAWMMIHCASAGVWGNAQDLEDVAKQLTNIDETLAAIYAKRSDMTIDEARDYMKAETWFNAEDALALGLATDVVETEERIAACIDTKHAKHFKNIPEAIHVGDAVIKADEITAGKLPETIENPAKSHAGDNVAPVAAKEAAQILVLDGRIYKKGQPE